MATAATPTVSPFHRKMVSHALDNMGEPRSFKEIHADVDELTPDLLKATLADLVSTGDAVETEDGKFGPKPGKAAAGKTAKLTPVDAPAGKTNVKPPDGTDFGPIKAWAAEVQAEYHKAGKHLTVRGFKMLLQSIYKPDSSDYKTAVASIKAVVGGGIDEKPPVGSPKPAPAAAAKAKPSAAAKQKKDGGEKVGRTRTVTTGPNWKGLSITALIRHCGKVGMEYSQMVNMVTKKLDLHPKDTTLRGQHWNGRVGFSPAPVLTDEQKAAFDKLAAPYMAASKAKPAAKDDAKAKATAKSKPAAKADAKTKTKKAAVASEA